MLMSHVRPTGGVTAPRVTGGPARVLDSGEAENGERMMAITWRKTEQVTAGALPAAVGKATAPDMLTEKTREEATGIVLIRVGGQLAVCVDGERATAIAAVAMA